MLALFPTRSALASYLVSIVVLLAIYYLTAYRLSLHHETALEASETDLVVRAKRARRKAKIRAWIVTATSSAVMTLGSLPFVWDLVVACGDVAKVQRREMMSEALTSFFLAYLAVDCFLGAIHYRESMNILTGWVHHSAYTALLFYVLKERFAHVFSLAAVMELPTFVLSLSVLVPTTRSDAVFSSLFFLTRILLHAVMIGLYITPYGRLYGTSTYDATGTPIASLVPILGLLAASPLHVTWFHASLQGMLRRRKAFLLECRMYTLAASSATASTSSLSTDASSSLPLDPSTASPPSPLLLPARPRLVSLASSYLASSRPLLFQSSSFVRQPFRRLNVNVGPIRPAGETYEALLLSAENFKLRLREARLRGMEIIKNRQRMAMDMGMMGMSAEGFKNGVRRLFEPDLGEGEGIPELESEEERRERAGTANGGVANMSTGMGIQERRAASRVRRRVGGNRQMGVVY